jgi:serine/threonine protein kinase
MKGSTTLLGGRYMIHGVLGHGAFSVVRLVSDVVSGQDYACKEISKSNITPSTEMSQFENEIRIIQQLCHPGVVRLYDLVRDSQRYYIIMELCSGGNLLKYILQNQRLSELEAKYYLKQMLEALQYIHAQGIVHRDLKPENILLDSDGHIKVSDFGLSRFVNSQGLADTPCGSPSYTAPECFTQPGYDGRKSDIWSVGVTTFAMLTGVLPWKPGNPAQLMNQMLTGDFVIPPYVSDAPRELLRKLMKPNPKERISVEDALADPWVKSAPVHRFRSNQPKLLVSLRHLDHFFGRDPSETELESTLLELEGSRTVRSGTIQPELTVTVPEQKRLTARDAAARLIVRQSRKRK